MEEEKPNATSDDDAESTNKFALLARQLPEDLVLRVLCRLPFLSYVRAFSLSKHCRSFLLQQLSSSRASQPWLVTYHDNVRAFAFDPVAASWRSLNLCFSGLPLAAAGGLLFTLADSNFFIHEDNLSLFTLGNTKVLWVVNPITGAYAHIPPPPSDRIHKNCIFAFLVQHHYATNFFLMTFQQHEDEGFIELYDSRHKRWKVGPSLPSELQPVFRHLNHSTFFHDKLYLPYHTGYSNIVIFVLTCNFDATSPVWNLSDTISLPWRCTRLHSRLHPYRNSLVVVGSTFSGYMNMYCISVDSAGSNPRVKQTRLKPPPEMHGRLCTTGFFQGFGDYLCFTMLKHSNKILSYNISEESWSWLPDCPTHPWCVTSITPTLDFLA